MLLIAQSPPWSSLVSTAMPYHVTAFQNKSIQSFTFLRCSLHLGIQNGPCEDELIKLDEAYVQNKYKVGLMYCGSGQQTEEEMYNNEEGSPAFNEFLELIGTKVRLKGFSKYKAGLCNKNDSTGTCKIWGAHSAEISEFFCPLVFSWNQFWRILSLKN